MVRRFIFSLFLTQIGLEEQTFIPGIVAKNFYLLSMVDPFKDFKNATEGGSSFRALIPAHLHKFHILSWGTVRRDLRPAVWFNPLPYIEEYF